MFSGLFFLCVFLFCFCFFVFLYISIATLHVKTDCKIQITVKKISDFRYVMNFFSMSGHCLQYRSSNFLVAYAKLLVPPSHLLYHCLNGRDGNFECDFSLKIRWIHLMRAYYLLPILLSFINF